MIIYQPSSETLRFMPNNFLIAFKHNGRFIYDIDLGLDKKNASKIYEACHSFEMKWGGGNQVAKKLNEVLTNNKLSD